MSLIGLVIGPSKEYRDKQLHPVPDMRVVDRHAWILSHVYGRKVLELGASGNMHEAIVEAASEVRGIDCEDGPGVVGYDLDDVSDYAATIPCVGMVPDVIVAGEVIEHLSNPGWLLERLRTQFAGVPLVITVPNAFSDVGSKSLERGIENVNIQHCAYYSAMTLKELLSRHGYTICDMAWYRGRPRFAEGLVCCAR